MGYVMFDVYTAQPLGLNGDDAEALAVELDRLAAVDLAGRVRYGLENEALVTLDESDRLVIVEALEALLAGKVSQREQAEVLVGNVRARIMGADLLPPPVEE
jgi:hypothetical protein